MSFLLGTPFAAERLRPVVERRGIVAAEADRDQIVVLVECRLGGSDFERSLIRERTQAGLAAARRLGRTGGRPPKLTDDDIEAAKALLDNPDIGVTQIAHRLGVSPATLYRYIPAARTANTPGV